MNFKIYIYLFNILSTFCFKQPIPFADSSLSKQGIHKIAIPGNEDVAVWWSMKDQKWNAVHDMCPHRQASLSSGIINPITNDIKCRYHGIEFDGCGKCTLIPSSNYNKNIFSVKNYYIKEKYDLLWIDDTDDNELPFIQVLEEQHYKFPWYISLENVPQKISLENGLDGTHVDHLHHNMIPFFNRYTGRGLMNFLSKNIWFNETGFRSGLYLHDETKTVDLLFISPYYTYIIDTINTGFSMHIPINDTHTRYIGSAVFPMKNGIVKNIIKCLTQIFLPFIKYVGNEIHKQDYNVFIEQIKNIEKYGEQYIYSGSGDIGILLYNKWLKKYGDQEQS